MKSEGLSNKLRPSITTSAKITDAIRLHFDLREELAIVIFDALAEGFEQQDVSVAILEQLTERFRAEKQFTNTVDSIINENSEVLDEINTNDRDTGDEQYEGNE